MINNAHGFAMSLDEQQMEPNVLCSEFCFSAFIYFYM